MSAKEKYQDNILNNDLEPTYKIIVVLSDILFEMKRANELEEKRQLSEKIKK